MRFVNASTVWFLFVPFTVTSFSGLHPSGPAANSILKLGFASEGDVGIVRNRTSDLMLLNGALSQEISIWRVLGGELRSKTIQIQTLLPGVRSKLTSRRGRALAPVIPLR